MAQRFFQNRWCWAVLLTIPLLWLYGAHFFGHDAQHHPSGMLQSENTLYLIAAKTYQQGESVFAYRYPLDDSTNSPAIFFQVPQFLLGYAMKWIPIDPGILLCLFGLVFTVICFRWVIRILDEVFPGQRSVFWVGLLFTWGGGLLSVLGALIHLAVYRNTGLWNDHLFLLDPGDGWWCLNFGRSFIYPMEAFYHACFVGAIWQLLKRKYGTFLLLSLVLTFSHPYTSTELLVIAAAWILLEFSYLKTKIVSKKGILFLVIALAVQAFYYGYFLRQFEVSRIISQQVALDWSYKIWNFLPAYILVWMLSFWAIRNTTLLKNHLSDYRNRLFLCWGIMAFLLSVHGFAIKPVQPLHYTRGYVYAGFFLFGASVLVNIWSSTYLQKVVFRMTILSAITLIFLSDNLIWCYQTARYNQTGMLYSSSQKELFKRLEKVPEKGWVVGPPDQFETTAAIQLYTSLKGWYPHPILSFRKEYKLSSWSHLIQSQQLAPEWQSQPTYLYIPKADTALSSIRFQFPIIFENEGFTVYQLH